MKLWNRKGDDSETGGLDTFVKLVVVAVVLFFFAGVYARGSSLLGGSTDRDSKLNFQSLAENVQLMIDKPDSFATQNMVFYLDKNSYVFGFTSQATIDAYKSLGVSSNYPSANYPSACKNKPCLCLYNDLKKFASQPVTCQSFGDSVVFHGSFGTQISSYYFASSQNGQNIESKTERGGYTLSIPKQTAPPDYPLELASDYAYYELALDQGSQIAQSLYVEKLASNGRIHIFITPYLSQDDIDHRFSLLANCPSTSDQGCIGKRVNTYTNANPSSYCFYDSSEGKCVLKTGFTDCALNAKIKADCLCGKLFADVQSADKFNGMYCLKKNDNYAILPFTCDTIGTDCANYCKTSITNAPECVGSEQNYCINDFCGLGCKIDGTGKDTVCKKA